MRMRGWLLIPMFGGAMVLSSCGGGGSAVVQQPQPSAAALAGNWQLIGRGDPLKPPSLSMTIEVQGNQVYGQALVSESCSGSVGSAQVGGLNMSGVVGADGSFKLTNADSRMPAIVITATAPVEGSTTWSGSYSVSGQVGIPTKCMLQDKGNFATTEIPALNGTYVGKLSGLAWPNGITVSTKISQQAPRKITSTTGVVTYTTPLTGTIQVSGTGCFTKGTVPDSSTGTAGAAIAGEVVQLPYLMDDGSTLLIDGHLTDATAKTLQVDTAYTYGGTCSTSLAIGTLTLQ